MGLLFEITYYFQVLFAPRIKVNSSDNTPILYENYKLNEYYVILNKNKANLYSIDELDRFIDKKIDPMTRQQIKYYKIVRIKY